MEVISYTAGTFNWILGRLALVTKVIFEANHDCVTFLIKVLIYVKTLFLETTDSILSVVYCFFNDFLTFMNEFGSGLAFIGLTTTNFVLKAVSGIYAVLCLVLYYLRSVYFYISAIIHSSIQFVFYLVQLVYALVTLVTSAMLLLLQLLPNIFVFSYEMLIYLIYRSFEGAHYCMLYSSNILYCAQEELQNAVFNIPTKAYIGLIMGIIFYYLHRTIIYYSKSFLYMCAILFLLTYTKVLYCIHLILVRIPQALFHRIRRLRIVPIPIVSVAGGSGQLPSHNTHLQSKLDELIKKLQDTKKGTNSEDPSVSNTEQIIHTLQQELDKEKDRHLCIVCQDREKDVILLPCRHFCICHNCCVHLNHSCPLCRRYVLDTINVFV